jgi:hypothetical protein
MPETGTDQTKSGPGRRTVSESQARVIRTRLVAWKQTPEQQRVSLRTLATELGTSHQLLSFYLKGLNDWQKKDYEARAQAIRDRAEAENRCMTWWEESEMKALERAAFSCFLDSVIQPALKDLETLAKAGKLSKRHVKTISLLARRGVPMAKKILEKYQNNGKKMLEKHQNNLPVRQVR